MRHAKESDSLFAVVLWRITGSSWPITMSAKRTVSKAKARMRTNPVNVLKAQPRFFTAALVGTLLWFLLPRDLRPSTRLLVAWDGATGLYLMMALVMIMRSNIDKIR